jgi:Cys-tRNA(Pro) deacylase
MSEDRLANTLPGYLDAMHVDATLIRCDHETPTVERAAAALGVAASAIVKSIVFEHKHDSSRVCLAIVGGAARVSRAKVAEALGLSQLRLAAPSTILRATGYRAGGVPPVGHRTRIPVVIDRRVLEQAVVYGGGGDEWHMVRIAPREIQRLTGAAVADVVEDAEDRRATEAAGT